jgi:hypothetical protein
LVLVCVLDSVVGGYSGRGTPGPIPNPVAKPSCADGTALDRVWESRSPPTFNFRGSPGPGLVRGISAFRGCGVARSRCRTAVVGRSWLWRGVGRLLVTWPDWDAPATRGTWASSEHDRTAVVYRSRAASAVIGAESGVRDLPPRGRGDEECAGVVPRWSRRLGQHVGRRSWGHRRSRGATGVGAIGACTWPRSTGRATRGTSVSSGDDRTAMMYRS